MLFIKVVGIIGIVFSVFLTFYLFTLSGRSARIDNDEFYMVYLALIPSVIYIFFTLFFKQEGKNKVLSDLESENEIIKKKIERMELIDRLKDLESKNSKT
jgi:hypothetical protein